MSLENEIKKLTAAVQANTEMLERVHSDKDIPEYTAPPAPVDKVPAPVAEVPASQPPAPQAPAEVVPTAVVPPPATAPAPAPAVARTPEQMNEILVGEFKRIGSREPIDAVMQSLGVTSVTELPVEKQDALIAAVQAIGK